MGINWRRILRRLTWQFLALGFFLILFTYAIYVIKDFKSEMQVTLAYTPNSTEDFERLFPGSRNMTYSEYQFNVQRSNMLRMDRAIPDSRPDECKSMYNGSRVEDLPTVTIIIPFHNEAWSVLIRALHSILNRSPAHLLKQIILVDDKSDLDHLQEPLDLYLRSLNDKRVELLRKSKRDGLMSARMDGARSATGGVLVFLDAHVEVNVHWLEPLLEAIRSDRRKIAIPTIDNIEAAEMRYTTWGPYMQGAFKWNLEYQWKRVHRDPYLPPRKQWEPTPTGTLIGCAIAVDREYFFHIGAYDEAMHIWGGENIEISFRTWLCGGSIYVYPCSRVGHVFRRFLPYTFPEDFGKNTVIQKNLQRVADIWMDDYKKYYFATLKKIFPPTEEESRSLKARKALRKKLKCKGFDWYLENIIPDMPTPKDEPIYYGQLMNAEDHFCLIQWTNSSDANYHFTTDICDAFYHNSTFSLTANHKIILQDSLCLAYNTTGHHSLDVTKCSKNIGNWTFVRDTHDRIKSIISKKFPYPLPMGRLEYRIDGRKLCLTLMRRHSVDLLPCDNNDTFQYWYFTYSFKYKSPRDMAPFTASDI